MIEQADVSSLKSMVIAILSGLALLALRAISTILRRAISGEKVPFLRVSIDFGSYRISVSPLPPSKRSKKPGRRMGVRASSSTAVRSRKAASSSNAQSDLSLLGGSLEASEPWRSSSGEDVPSDQLSRGRGQEP